MTKYNFGSIFNFMIRGLEYGERLPVNRTNNSAVWGEVVAVVFKEAVDRQMKSDALDKHIRSFVGKGNTVSADPDRAREYVSALDDKLLFTGSSYWNRLHRFTEIILGANVELSLTGVESEDVVGSGVLRTADFKKGTLSLESPEDPSQSVQFTHITAKSNELAVDFELLNIDDVRRDVYPIVDYYLH